MKKMFAILLILFAISGCAKKDRGPEPLDDKAIRDLIVGKTLVIQNRKSGKLYGAIYHENGQRILRSMTEQQNRQSAAHSLDNGSVSAATAPYEIRDGKIITTFDGVPFGVTIYKIEGKYVASRIGEGGAMNWKLIAIN
jgi:hypothetical protein